MQAQHQVRCGHAFAVDIVRHRQHFLHLRHALRNRFPGAAAVLDAERAQQVVFLQVLRAEQRTDLIRLAPQPDHQHAGEIGMPGVAAERAAQHVDRLAGAAHAAAGAVRQRDDAIDVRIVGEDAASLAIGPEVIRDRAHHGRRTIDRGQNSDVVAGRDPAIGADYSHERRGLGCVVRGLDLGAERVIAGELAHRQIVQMHLLARPDGPGRKADDLVVALDRLALGDRARGDLVARRDEPDDGDVFIAQQGAADQLLAGDDDVVLRVQADGERGGCEHLTDL